jgi:hypothetical protein
VHKYEATSGGIDFSFRYDCSKYVHHLCGVCEEFAGAKVANDTSPIQNGFM